MNEYDGWFTPEGEFGKELEVRAKAEYADRMKRAAGSGWPAWEDLDDPTKSYYYSSAANRLKAGLPGPWERLLITAVEPWAVPIFNALTRQFDKLGAWIMNRRAR